MKKILILFLILFTVSFIVKEDVANFFTGATVTNIPEQNEKMLSTNFGSIEVHFCPQEDCEQILTDEINKANTVDCAFFELNLEKAIDALSTKEYRVIVDDKYFDELPLENTRNDNRKELMHNKFCIFDHSKVFTGSFNPTKNDATRNNNNLVIIESVTMAKNYEEEFNEMWSGVFGRGKQIQEDKLYLNGFLVENYFCPDDSCEERTLKFLQSAKKRIYFMTFSFTSDDLGEEIIKNYHYDLDVKGVFDTTQAGSTYSEIHKMAALGIDVRKDETKGFMHHKVFIVDDAVLFGSYNPTSSGDEDNDENVVIIYNKEITEQFVEEFEKIYSLGEQQKDF
mgnify:CR=1 FL=1